MRTKNKKRKKTQNLGLKVKTAGFRSKIGGKSEAGRKENMKLKLHNDIAARIFFPGESVVVAIIRNWVPNILTRAEGIIIITIIIAVVITVSNTIIIISSFLIFI